MGDVEPPRSFLRNTSTNTQMSNLADCMGYSNSRTSGQGTQRETMFLFQVFTFFIVCRSRGDVGKAEQATLQWSLLKSTAAKLFNTGEKQIKGLDLSDQPGRARWWRWKVLSIAVCHHGRIKSLRRLGQWAAMTTSMCALLHRN